MFPSIKPQGRRDNPHKVYVKVRCDCDFDGQIRPIMLRTEESRALKIDRITDVRMAASTKAGGYVLYQMTKWADDREEPPVPVMKEI